MIEGVPELDEMLERITAAQEGDEAAKTRLLTENSPLIKSVIRRYRGKGVEYEDLYQLGCIGFLKAIRNFSAQYGVKFSTYAVPMIAGEVKRFLRDDGIVKVSRVTKTLASKIARFTEEYRATHDAAPSIETIAEALQVDPEEAVFAMDAARYPLSLDEPSEDDRSRTLLDRIADSETVEDRLDKIMLRDAVSALGEREKTIVILRYYRDKTQSEVARVLGVSQVQVSRLESKILRKLREALD